LQGGVRIRAPDDHAHHGAGRNDVRVAGQRPEVVHAITELASRTIPNGSSSWCRHEILTYLRRARPELELGSATEFAMTASPHQTLLGGIGEQPMADFRTMIGDRSARGDIGASDDLRVL